MARVIATNIGLKKYRRLLTSIKIGEIFNRNHASIVHYKTYHQNNFNPKGEDLYTEAYIETRRLFEDEIENTEYILEDRIKVLMEHKKKIEAKIRKAQKDLKLTKSKKA